MFTTNTARQPATPRSSPPRLGPTTAIVDVAIDSTVSTPSGLSVPVRSASPRISAIAAG